MKLGLKPEKVVLTLAVTGLVSFAGVVLVLVYCVVVTILRLLSFAIFPLSRVISKGYTKVLDRFRGMSQNPSCFL